MLNPNPPVHNFSFGNERHPYDETLCGGAPHPVLPPA